MKQEQVLLITGASSGIGKETALLAKQHNFKVYACARRTEQMQDLAQAGIEVLFLDLMIQESITQCVTTFLQKEGRIDILINNAGYGLYGAIEDVPLDKAKEQFQINLFSLASLIQLVLPSMRAQKSGKIINVGSIAGKVWTPFGGWYHASKFALEGFSDCLRLELKPFGIDVVLIEPGGIKTDWGHIAAQNLQQISANGAYAQACMQTAKSMEQNYTDNMLSPPSLIAKTILKAILAKRPKTRYLIGFMAKPMLFVKRIFGDNIYDAIVARAWIRKW